MALSSNIKTASPETIQGGPTAFVIFGATGDLASKKIFPSFFELFRNNLLPAHFKIVTAARSDYSNESFLNKIRGFIKEADQKHLHDFSKLVEYVRSDVAKNENLDEISKKLNDFEKEIGSCVQRTFYMAISPAIYKEAFANLGKNELNLGCKLHGKKARIVTEKPFGSDFASAQELNKVLNKYFDEDQIYRIDHFLGKETVQNIFAFRFGNEIFEPVWNKNYIDHVQITLAERVGIEKRGEFYDKFGALRDVVQNHMMQLLTLVTMEEPQSFNRESIRKSKIEVLKSIKRMTPEEVLKSTARGQYEGYKNEEKVDKNSRTETFALVKLEIENERWQGVPFYLRTGKKLMGDVVSVIFQFKERGHELFKNFWDKPIPNSITLQIQPDEGIGIRLAAKKPGLTTTLEPVDMEFCYRKSFDVPQPNAYERLLLDIIIGDQTLFLGKVGASWKIIDPIEETWQKQIPNLQIYKPGSWGPKAADDLIKRDGRQWLAPLLTICKI